MNLIGEKMNAIPDYQSIMLPLLKVVNDEQEHRFRDLIETLSEYFGLDDNQRKELLPSGSQLIFDNRVGWAKTYLKKAGLIEYTKRGVIKITARGMATLQENIDKIDVKYLKRFEEFNEFQSISTQDDSGIGVIENIEQTDQTPEEQFEKSYQHLRTNLAQELLDKARNVTPAFFERLVVELLVKMGYGGSISDAGKAIGKTGDEGIDGTIKEDKLGLDIIYIQAKRWQAGNSVGRPEIQKFVGALAGQGAKKGIFITTSNFTKDALDYTPKNETKIVLIDGIQLSQLMIDYNLGVSSSQVYELKRMDNDYIEDE